MSRRVWVFANNFCDLNVVRAAFGAVCGQICDPEDVMYDLPLKRKGLLAQGGKHQHRMTLNIVFDDQQPKEFIDMLGRISEEVSKKLQITVAPTRYPEDTQPEDVIAKIVIAGNHAHQASQLG